MKLTIESDRPLSREDLVKAVRNLTRGHAHDREPRPMEYAALQGTIDHHQAVVEKVRARMVKKLERVLKDA